MLNILDAKIKNLEEIKSPSVQECRMLRRLYKKRSRKIRKLPMGLKKVLCKFYGMPLSPSNKKSINPSTTPIREVIVPPPTFTPKIVLRKQTHLMAL